MNDDMWDDITNPHVAYYDRQGHRISLRQWGDLKYQKPDYYRIAESRVGQARISTVWLGLDHRHVGEGPPIIFETMIFGGPEDQEMERYCTEAEAIAGHEWHVRQQRRWRNRWKMLRQDRLDDRRLTDIGIFLIALAFVGGGHWGWLPVSVFGGFLVGFFGMRRLIARRRRVQRGFNNRPQILPNLPHPPQPPGDDESPGQEA